MPATEPEQPDLPLWPEPGTKRGNSAGPLPAREAAAAGPTPAPANVPPATPTAAPEPSTPMVGRQGDGARPPRPGPNGPCPAPRLVPPEAEPSWWDGQARRR